MAKPVVSAEQAAQLVADNDVVTISASSGLGCPGWSGMQRLAELIGASRVRYLALNGTRIDDAGRGEGVAVALEAMAGALAANTNDAREGIESFREKRPAAYRGR